MTLTEIRELAEMLSEDIHRYENGDELISREMIISLNTDFGKALSEYQTERAIGVTEWIDMDIKRMKGLESRIKELKEQVQSFRKQYQELKEGGKK